MGPSTTRRAGDGWRGALLKALLAVSMMVASWWTAYVWARIQDIPGRHEVAKWTEHVDQAYPALRNRVDVVATKYEATQASTDKQLEEMNRRLASIEALLREGRR